jgi:hypothetical protein
VFPGPLFILVQESTDGIKKIRLVIKDRQRKDARKTPEKSCGGNAEIEEVKDLEATIIDIVFKSSEADAFSHTGRAVEQGNTASFQPKMETIDKFLLCFCVKHFGGPHILGEREFRKTEVGFEMEPLLVHDDPPISFSWM